MQGRDMCDVWCVLPPPMHAAEGLLTAVLSRRAVELNLPAERVGRLLPCARAVPRHGRHEGIAR